MILLAHNVLKCISSDVDTSGYPLQIKATDIKINKEIYRQDWVIETIPGINYYVLYKAAESMGHAGDLPPQLIENYENNEEFLKKMHHLLLEVNIISGELICPVSGKKFTIKNGIPEGFLFRYHS